ncbi:Iron transport multicopper oxidase fio1 [Leucoagaricus sp. SymC.cos]|nr:Iron transport multicopper oxidase fio1 [Leucoagaricus sp. SymC.cos]
MGFISLYLPRFLALWLSFVPFVLGGVQEVWWDITYVENANPDGLFERRVVGVNGTWPPPPLDVNTTDTLVLHAHNSLDEATTLHHHGMFFNTTSWMDGASGVSECGIPPNGDFDYVIPINSSGQWGTYWVHAHASGQYVDGLRAPLLLHPQREVHSYDEEFTVVLGDWYHDQHADLLKKFISIANPGGAEPVPDSALVYFAQNATYLGPIAGTSPSPVTSAVGFNENTTLPFQPGKTYRLRIVNTSGFAAFFFWIDGHDMRIIEVDGTDVEESPIDLLGISVAQRYSVLVTARNDTSSNWAIHANMDVDMFDSVPEALNPNVTSSITYNSSASITNSGFVNEYHDVDDVSLAPIQQIAQPRATKTIELEVIFDTMDDGTNHGSFNSVVYNSPQVPAILSSLTLGSNATVEQAYGPQSFVVNHMDVVDLVIKNADAGKHPFHLHGHKPMLVGRSQDYTSDDPTLNPPVEEGQSNPMRRDTVHIPSMGSVTLRVVADNPGVWLFHCHIEWHLEAGLAFQLVEAPLVAQQHQAQVPQKLKDNCEALGRPISGNAAGKASTTDLKGLTVGPFPQQLGWHAKGIGAMFGCVLTATIGMASVVWYTLGGYITEEEMEEEVQAKIAAKEKRGRFFGLLRRQNM